MYRRHLKACGKTCRKERRCRCPIYVEGTLAGEWVKKSLDLTSWEAATEKVRSWETSGSFEQQNAVSISDAVSSFIADALNRNLADSTFKKYKLVTRLLQEFCERKGYTNLKQVGVADVRDFRTTWNDGPRAAQKKLERVRSFFRFCQDAAWIDTNPGRAVKSPVIKDRQILPFSSEEMEKILESVDDVRLRAFILILRHSGLRIGDGALLTTDRINQGKLFLYTQKSGTPVWLPLPPFVVNLLNSLPKRGNYYFLFGESTKMNTAADLWRRRLAKIFTAAGIHNGHPHRFRHTFAVSLLQEGVPIEVVSILLGHASIAVTNKHYSAWVKSRQDQLETAVMKTWSTKLVRVK